MDQDGHREPMATDSKGRIIYAKPTSKPSSTAKTSSNKSNTSTNKSSIAIVVSSGGGGSKHEYVYIPDPRQYYEIQNILINSATTEDAFSQIKNILFKEKNVTIKSLVLTDTNNTKNMSILSLNTNYQLSESKKEFILNNLPIVNATNCIGEFVYDKVEAASYMLKYTNVSILDRLAENINDDFFKTIYDPLFSILNMNPNYCIYFGNNCANTVSQALFEGGGLPMRENYVENSSWYYKSNTYLSNNYSFQQIIREILNYSKPSVSLSWSVADDQYRYFSDPTNGYTSMEPIVIHNEEEYYEALSMGIIETGDLVYFELDDDPELDHAAMITEANIKELYYSCKSVERHNNYLDPNIDFEDKTITIIHMNEKVYEYVK